VSSREAGPLGEVTEVTALPDVLEVVPAGPLSGDMGAPPSKSVTNRLLVMAALADGTSILHDPLESHDTRAMAGGLTALGATLERRPARRPSAGGWEIALTGTGGHVLEPQMKIDAGLSGTTLRFLSAVALLVHGGVTIDGSPPLRRRPIAPLLDALASLGGVIASEDGHPPLHIASNGLRGGRVRIDAAESSQFATALLLVAPYADQPVEITVSGLGAGGYVDLTLAAMERWGAPAQAIDRGRYFVEGGRCYEGRRDDVEFDASAAAHLWALGLATGGSVTVSNAQPTVQPDGAVVEVFEQMGATVTADAGGDGEGVTVCAPDRLKGVEVDISSIPDQLPTLGVLGALACGTTRLTHAAVTRGHETDRLSATATELGRVGVAVEIDGDTLVVQGGSRLRGAEIRTYEDHRMAMAFAALAAAVPGVTIRDPGCVRKTYPGFWGDAARLGLVIRPPLER
jgi:3-phosphoshikimate 1-carboxyvinyltransferase